MKKYFFNFLLTALCAFLIAVLTFLFGRNEEAAMVGGSLGGISIATSYMFGKLMEGAGWTKEMGIRLVVMLITGILFGIFGGFSMTL